MNRLLRRILVGTGSFVVIALLILNIQLYRGPDLNNREDVSKAVRNQLNYLRRQLRTNSAAESMQGLFSEGFVFTYALYGLTWCELALHVDEDVSLQAEALQEARYAYDRISSEDGRKQFPEKLTPSHGIFYRGWQNYLLAKIVRVDRGQNTSERELLAKHSQEIANAFSSIQSPYLDSYSGAAWPADNVVAIASIRLASELLEVEYIDTIESWLRKVDAHLDPRTGLVPHSSVSGIGEPQEGARGSSSSLILRLMNEVDAGWTKAKFGLFHKHFIDKLFGIPFVREYPNGSAGSGDEDSGPIMFGIGPAATIVGVGMLAQQGDHNVAQGISTAIHAFGLPITLGSERRFLFGAMPVADAFIAWSLASTLSIPDSGLEASQTEKPVSFLIVHLASVVLSLAILFGLRLMRTRTRQ